jgi:serpin B
MRTITAIGIVAFAVVAGMVAGVDRKAPASKAAKEKVVKGNLAFALDLYSRLRGEEGNLFFSPYSISTALAMTYAGARDETAEQMAKVLHFDVPAGELPSAFAAVDRELTGTGAARKYQLYTANALWAQKGHPFLPAYVHLIRQAYHAGLNEVDFQNATEEARRTINAWVEKQTREKIKDLLAPGVLDNMTRLVLTNAIYFKGDWERPFKKGGTRQEPFHITAKEDVSVPMMHQKAHFQYLDQPDFQVLQMPYKGKDLALVVLLPRKVDGLAALEETLTMEKLTACLGELSSREVAVSFPKFRMTEELQLAKTLSAMGMSLAFSAGRADFSGMDGSHELFVSAVVHKAFVDVNEEGTEAAAATGIGVVATAARIDQTIVFRADHPFLLLIRDTRSGGVLFMGRLTQPRT